MKWLLLILTAGVCLAQTGPAPEFEVVSVKPNKSGSGSSRYSSSTGLLRVENNSVRSLLVNAFDILEEQIAGAPEWIGSEHYDIQARYEPDSKLSGKEEGAANQARLQALLVGRFGLKYHRETRELRTYALVVGKKGAKLTPAANPKGMSMHSSNGHWEMKGIEMESLARNLSHRVGSPVVNETAIDGRFDLTLDFDQETQAIAGKDTPIGGVDTRKPSLFTALQDQLGLKLEARKAPVDMLVIDHIERAADN